MIFRAFFTFVLLGALAAPASAYLDPGTGSFALQMLLAGVLAAGASIRIFWYRVKTVFGRLLGHETMPPDARVK